MSAPLERWTVVVSGIAGLPREAPLAACFVQQRQVD